MAKKQLTAVELAKKKLADARKGLPKGYLSKTGGFSDKEEQLKAKMAAAMPESVAPSMVPAPKKNKKEPEPPPPDLKELDMDDDDRKQIAVLVTQAADYKGKASAANKALKPLSDRIKGLMVGMPKENHRFMWWGTRVNMTEVKRTTIDKQLLLEHGISPAVISACTRETTSQTLTITPAGASEDE